MAVEAMDYTERVFNCFVIRKESKLGDMYLNMMEDDNGEPFKVFIEIGKAGSEIRAWNDALALTISKLLEKKLQVVDIIVMLSGISSDASVVIDGVPVTSGLNAVVLALTEYKNIKFQERMKKYESEMGSDGRKGQWRKRNTGNWQD